MLWQQRPALQIIAKNIKQLQKFNFQLKLKL